MKRFETVDGLPAFGQRNDSYALLKSGPDVDPEEVEITAATAVEIVILWGTNVIHVDHLTPPRSYFVGDGTEGACDFILPPEKLGTTRAPVVLVENGAIDLVVLGQAKGVIELQGGQSVALKDAIADGRAAPCHDVPGAVRIPLAAGATARVEIDGLVLKVAAVSPGKAPAHPLFSDADNHTPAYVGMSFIAHTGLLAVMAFFVPPFGLNDAEGAARDQRYLIEQYMTAIAIRETESKPAADTPAPADAKEGGRGQGSPGEEGKVGTPTTTKTGGRFAIKGPADTIDPKIARQMALDEARTGGFIGVLNASTGGEPRAPTSPWGGEESIGRDPLSARGEIWGATIDDAFGANGLGLSGIGEGSDRPGTGIGLGAIGTVDHGGGNGLGQLFGPGGSGFSRGRSTQAHAPQAPQLRLGKLDVGGRLPPEVIQRVVRQNYGRFRLCYENGLRSNPSLQGRVEIRFVIGRDGAVSNVANGASDLPDAAVVSCVTRAYYGLSFPEPESGVVRVVYPIMFSPGSP